MIGEINDGFVAFIANQPSFVFYLQTRLSLVIFLSATVVHLELERPGISLIPIRAHQAHHGGILSISLYFV